MHITPPVLAARLFRKSPSGPPRRYVALLTDGGPRGSGRFSWLCNLTSYGSQYPVNHQVFSPPGCAMMPLGSPTRAAPGGHLLELCGHACLPAARRVLPKARRGELRTRVPIGCLRHREIGLSFDARRAHPGSGPPDLHPAPRAGQRTAGPAVDDRRAGEFGSGFLRVRFGRNAKDYRSRYDGGCRAKYRRRQLHQNLIAEGYVGRVLSAIMNRPRPNRGLHDRPCLNMAFRERRNPDDLTGGHRSMRYAD
jgi:hypothetical protein